MAKGKPFPFPPKGKGKPGKAAPAFGGAAPKLPFGKKGGK